MKLQSVGISSFKAFGPQLQRIPIKPITLVFGPNSAGKSSLLHSLLWLHHAVTRGDTDVHEPAAANGDIDLGGFDACVNQGSQREENCFTIHLHGTDPELDSDWKPWLGGISDYGVEMTIARKNHLRHASLKAFKINLDEKALFSGKGNRYDDSLARIDWDHPVLPFREKMTKKAFKEMVEASRAHGLFRAKLAGVLPNSLIEDWFGRISVDIALREHVPENPSRKAYFPLRECRGFLINTIPHAMTSVLEQFAEIIKELRYLPPLRSIPQRSENLRSCRDAAWKKLADDSSLLNSVNRTLGDLKICHQLDVRKLVPETGATDEFDHVMHLSIRDTRTNARVNLQDVGVGTGQVLPIVIEAHANKNRLIIVEQPEVHVHPALQAELGDVFIESALGENKNTFLLETHSEHLILRILRRIRETTEGETGDWPKGLRDACPNGIRPEDVAVLYVRPGDNGSEVIELPVDANGEFTCDWPGGFFEERLKEFF